MTLSALGSNGLDSQNQNLSQNFEILNGVIMNTTAEWRETRKLQNKLKNFSDK